MKDDYLTLKNYKEPLLPVVKGEGHGYYGAILVSIDGQKMQCHVCGELFGDVGVHARMKHKISTGEYRAKFRLSPTTALISESERQRRKELTLKWLQSLSEHQKRMYRMQAKNGRKARKRFQPKEALESKNKKGTCPDQLIAKIHEVARKLNHTPSLAEFIHETGGQRYKHLILTTFGTWLNALKMAKLQPKEKVEGTKRRRYSNEELLEYLSIYAQENRKKPTATDSKRGLIPNYETYQRRFGTFENARKEAGVYNFLE